MDYEYHGQIICTEQMGDDEWEAWLEFDEQGALATGATEADAAQSLRDKLDAEAEEAWEMRQDAMDAQAAALRAERAEMQRQPLLPWCFQ